LLRLDDACSPGHILETTMTQYDPNQDVLGNLLKRNGLKHIDELHSQYVKVIVLIRNLKRKNNYLFEVKSLEVIRDHNEITYHITKVIQ